MASKLLVSPWVLTVFFTASSESVPQYLLRVWLCAESGSKSWECVSGKSWRPCAPEKFYMLAGKDIYKHSTKYSAHAGWQ